MSALTGERDRIVSEYRKLEGRLETLDNELAEMARKTEAAAGDMETLAQLKIETEQLAEAKHMIDRQIVQTKKRLTVIEKVIAMQIQSDMA